MVDGGLRQLFRRHLPEWDWQPIETGALSPGVPDLNGCRQGREVWVEMKHTTGWVVKFRPMQPSWILRRLAAGGHVYIAVRQRQRTTDRLYLYRGEYVLQLQEIGLRCASWSVCLGQEESEWYWPSLDGQLMGYFEQ